MTFASSLLLFLIMFNLFAVEKKLKTLTDSQERLEKQKVGD